MNRRIVWKTKERLKELIENQYLIIDGATGTELQKKEIKKEFEKDVDLIVDAGDSESSVPSTIVRIDGDGFSVVRKGAVAL